MDPSPDSTRYAPNPEVIAQHVKHQLLLLDMRTNRFYELNRTASRFWDHLAAGKARTQIEEQLLREFEVEQPRLGDEIDRLLAALLDERLIEVLR
jgi:hypothetical protein